MASTMFGSLLGSLGLHNDSQERSKSKLAAKRPTRDQEEFAIQLLELCLAVCVASSGQCMNMAMASKASAMQALRALTALARSTGVLHADSSTLPSRDVAMAFVLEQTRSQSSRADSKDGTSSATLRISRTVSSLSADQEYAMPPTKPSLRVSRSMSSNLSSDTSQLMPEKGQIGEKPTVKLRVSKSNLSLATSQSAAESSLSSGQRAALNRFSTRTMSHLSNVSSAYSYALPAYDDGMSGVNGPSFLEFFQSLNGAEAGGGNASRNRSPGSDQDDPLNQARIVSFPSEAESEHSLREGIGDRSLFKVNIPGIDGARGGQLVVSSSCLKTQTVWQQQLIRQQKTLLSHVSSKLEAAAQFKRLDAAVGEEQREILRAFRKIIMNDTAKTDDSESGAPVTVVVVDIDETLSKEINHLCGILGYPCRTYHSFTDASTNTQSLVKSSVTVLVLLGRPWLQREIPDHWTSENCFVAFTSKAEEFEDVGKDLDSSNESEIRDQLRFKNIREYLLHPLSLEDLQRTALRAQQRHFAEEYLVTAVLGRGGCGVVHRAKRLQDGRLFALKEISTRQHRRDTRESLEFEIQLLQQLSWPSIVKCESTWENAQQHMRYIAMPLLEGGSLSDVINDDLAAYQKACKEGNDSLSSKFFYLRADEGKLQDRFNFAEDWFAQSLHGLTYMHWKGILHRDIKPANILLASGRRRLQLCDLGSAMQLEGNVYSNNSVSAAVCTPDYGAPETLLESVHYAASDIWQIGVSFYEVLTLQRLLPDGVKQQLSFSADLYWSCRQDDGDEPVKPLVPKEAMENSTATAPGIMEAALQKLSTIAREANGFGAMHLSKLFNDLPKLLHFDPSQRPSAAALVSQKSRMVILNQVLNSHFGEASVTKTSSTRSSNTSSSKSTAKSKVAPSPQETLEEHMAEVKRICKECKTFAGVEKMLYGTGNADEGSRHSVL
eukprot:TRINITY_DN81842_c0_g1_i2.p1 TRINITY_DN81842_c0_g1~~TRINITY_DN81842_c0_g1_i2.p1  ORF type:complete len:960 (+),score=192.77 TRINITY_DN81842_c0_g1_i2:37-2880(+)